ncbi:MAG TPA: hypothetical protein VD997_08670 [Phycisphaerales bacterium]|nr:hypothetical protein [Phycisphaerales bacterium]
MKTLSVAALLAAFASTALGQVPTEWTFRVVAREGASGFGIPNGAELVQNDPGLDDQGNACVRYTMSGGEGIFVWSAAEQSSRVVVTNASALYSSSIDMLNGRIALSLNDGGVELRDYNGNLLDTYPVGGTEGITGPVTRARLTTTGAIGYRGSSGGISKHILDRFVGATRVQTLLASTDGATPYSFLYSPTVNAGHQMASKADLRSGGAGVVRWQEGQAPVIIQATAGSPYNLISNGTDLNDAGQVAFFVRVAADSSFRLMRGDGTADPVVIASSEPFNPAGLVNNAFANFPPVINNNGLVAFRPNDPTQAIYIGDGTTLVRVVGDSSFITLPDGTQFSLGAGTGNPRTSLVGNIALNGANQIAFIGRLSDGSDALIIATPVPTGNGCGTSDFNGDGDFGTDQDIEAFFACIGGNCCPTCFPGGSDFNGDGDAGTDQDIESFFRVLGGGNC